MKTAVVAIGGNALIAGGERGTPQEELGHARAVAEQVVQLIHDGWSVVVTHGNGPQVGFILRRSELTIGLDPTLPRLTLDHCVAETQGGLGYLLALAISNELRRRSLPDPVAALVTRALVDPNDPALSVPTKPIGGFYGDGPARRLASELGWAMAADPAGRGQRRTVVSPDPVSIPESPAIAVLLRSGHTVIAGGGGGIAVVRDAEGRERGVEAVIDKDLTSALLATDLRADLLVLCTNVEAVAVDFGKPTQKWLDRLDVLEAERLLREGQFPAGSMGPKVKAALRFIRGTDGRGEAVITSTERLSDALKGATGTRFVLEPDLSHIWKEAAI